MSDTTEREDFARQLYALAEGVETGHWDVVVWAKNYSPIDTRVEFQLQLSSDARAAAVEKAVGELKTTVKKVHRTSQCTASVCVCHLADEDEPLEELCVCLTDDPAMCAAKVHEGEVPDTETAVISSREQASRDRMRIGSNSARQSVGEPGHCNRCAKFGHVKAHPNLGCGDVGCDSGH